MARKFSKISPQWWDYTTLEDELIQEAATLNEKDLRQLSRPGFEVVFYDTLEEFYLAEALEYVSAWKEATPDNPVGICGPIGPTEQLPLVAQLVNELDLDLSSAHFWGMDEWIGKDGKAVSMEHPLSFERADRELCFDHFKHPIPEENLHFPTEDLESFASSWEGVRCKVMQGGQGDVKHWAFNDPLKREGAYLHEPPSPGEYRELGTRIVELHPITLSQNARTSGGGNLSLVPDRAVTVGPVETWKAERVSIWQAGVHDNPLGQRLTALMISKGLADSAVPMSLLADHPDVKFSYFRGGLGACSVEMH
tara:strand:+ start:4185 stop:5111 length:927 start_codon:yes stop_codon:yes gene_type:complete